MARPHAGPTEVASMVRLSGRLTRSLRTLIDSSPFAGLGPIEVARVVGVDKTLVSRLMSALRASDSLVALSLLPGAVPLRDFISSARTAGARPRAAQTAERELRAFEHELQRAFGTRTRLDAALTDAVPEARERHNETARQAVYRGMALIKGVSIDLESYTWVVHPRRQNPKRADLLFLGAMMGMHRLRPTARLRVGGRHELEPPEAGARLLRQFCRPANLSITTSTDRDDTYYEISTGSVRRDGAADVFLSELMKGGVRVADSTKEKETWTVGDFVEHPVKRLELNLFLHEAVWPGAEFSLRAYEVGTRGVVHLPDPAREVDRLPIQAPVIRSLADLDALRSAPVREYAAVLHHLMEPLRWSWTGSRGRPAFRWFRSEVAYPVYGSQVVLVRELDEARAPAR